MTRKPENRWICQDEKTLFHSPFMDILQRECKSSEDERTHRFYVFRARDWANVIPVTEDGKIVMVKQFRIGIDEHTLEVPGGVLDAGEDIEHAALRELAEETGYVPLPGAKVTRLGWSFPNPAIQNNRQHALIVGPVRREKAQELDEGEMIEVVEIPLEEIPERIARGEITHALMLNTFFYLTLRSRGGAEALREELRSYSTASSSKS